MTALTIIGGGLAGSEAAWQAASRGIEVNLYEMRPGASTGAHQTDYLAELVCSNSLGSALPDRAGGVLKSELRTLGSLLLDVAEQTAVPAGACLAVDRDAFARAVTERLLAHPNVRVVREELPYLPDTPTVVASGPLTSPALARALAAWTGEDHLYFYDAISPIVTLDSVDFTYAFRASRYDKGEQEDGDYVNCPMTREEYEAFVDALVDAERTPHHEFERDIDAGVRAGLHTYFEGCLPVEIIAARGRESLAFGPMRPVGIVDPRTGRRPYAVLQLRQDNLAGSLYNMVGFQTNLRFPEQRRVFGMIPGLANAEYVRFGQMHRNTFIASPVVLAPTLQARARADLLFAGQITGVEGYAGNIATGLLAGWNAARLLRNEEPLALPRTTMLGALCHYVTHSPMSEFQPMKANFGILPELDADTLRPARDGKKGRKLNKRERAAAYAARAAADLEAFLDRETHEPRTVRR